MTFHRDRHTVLAGNVANVDTPGYLPFDLEQVAEDGGGGLGLAATRSGHLDGGGAAGARVRMFEDAGELRTADGNAVNLERELSKIDANRVRYHTSSALVSRRIALLKYAATDGVG